MKHLSTLSLSIISLTVLATGVVLADNVRNDIATHPGSDTVTVGSSTTIGYKVTATSVDDTQANCNASDGTASVVTIQPPPEVLVSPSSLSFTLCNSTKYATFTGLVAGDYQIPATVSDDGGGSFNPSFALFTLHVLPLTSSGSSSSSSSSSDSSVSSESSQSSTSSMSEASSSSVSSISSSSSSSVEVSSSSASSLSSTSSESSSVSSASSALSSSSSSVHASYHIVKFQAPLSIDWKLFKKDSTIPVKVQVTDDFGLPVANIAVLFFVDGSPAVASGNSNTGNLFRYDALTQQYIFNLSTKPVAPGSHVLLIQLEDGTQVSKVITVK